MTVLADTSVWVEFLRRAARGPAAPLRGLVERGEVVVCGPVVAELVAGAREPERETLWRGFQSLPWADLQRSDWRRVGEVGAELRHRGGHLPMADVAIAVAAVSVGAELWTFDTDFDRVAGVLPELRRFEP